MTSIEISEVVDQIESASAYIDALEELVVRARVIIKIAQDTGHFGSVAERWHEDVAKLGVEKE